MNTVKLITRKELIKLHFHSSSCTVSTTYIVHWNVLALGSLLSVKLLSVKSSNLYYVLGWSALVFYIHSLQSIPEILSQISLSHIKSHIINSYQNHSLMFVSLSKQPLPSCSRNFWSKQYSSCFHDIVQTNLWQPHAACVHTRHWQLSHHWRINNSTSLNMQRQE